MKEKGGMEGLSSRLGLKEVLGREGWDGGFVFKIASGLNTLAQTYTTGRRQVATVLQRE
jgi:hypothetical protein